MRAIFATAALALALPLAPAIAQDAPAEEPAKPEKITDKNHPDYVRCRSESVIGSRAKKRKVCLTNRQWAEVGRDGNSVASRMVEESRAGMVGN